MHPSVHRELVDLLYTALPQVAAITIASVAGAVALAVNSGDIGYAVIAGLLALTAGGRLHALFRYPRAALLTSEQVLGWERGYGLGASAFGLCLGLLSFRALTIGDGPGAWISFGLAMSFCVGMVSRAAVRPWIVMVTGGALLLPILTAGLMRPEFAYKLGALLLILFWFTLREASRHLSRAFTGRLEAQRALAHQASHDGLTGLPNRAAFLTALEAAAAPGRPAFAVIAVDLDGFKPVNDRGGHQAGDRLLREVADRLRGCIGDAGMAARIGGDEFLLLLPFDGPEPDRERALHLARTVVSRLGRPFEMADGTRLRIGASAGIVMAAAGEAQGGSGLLEAADRALYAAKRAGGGRWQWAGEESPAASEAAVA